MNGTRHFFPGANTPGGFYSFFDHIIVPGTGRVFVLKGGPGTGKSTFMKDIGLAAGQRGFPLEHHHCSLDHHSLDAIVIPALRIALIDGTAPHEYEPRFPGCGDEIINLGECWNSEALAAGRDRITALGSGIRHSLEGVWRYLCAAQAVQEDIAACNRRAQDARLVRSVAGELAEALFRNRNRSPDAGRIRHLFACAITGEGMHHFLDTIFSPDGRIWLLEGEPGSGRSAVLGLLAREAQDRGIDTEAFHSPLAPEKIEHLWWPDLAAGISTSPSQNFCADVVGRIDMNSGLSRFARQQAAGRVAAARQHFEPLFRQAVENLRQAKQLHDDLEEIYTPCMDFSAVSQKRDRVLNLIECECMRHSGDSNP